MQSGRPLLVYRFMYQDFLISRCCLLGLPFERHRAGGFVYRRTIKEEGEGVE